ncbi:MAG: PH domain-containing protein [Anaerolineae bacterium]|nr:PH domain-containing protein [Phycisphaerae bacterium]
MTSPLSDIPPQTSVHEEAPHKPADDREEVYFHGSPLLRGEVGRLLGFSLIAIVLVAIPIVYKVSKDVWPPMWVIIACVILAIVSFLIPVIITKTYRYRISNYRIDYERGLLSRNIDTLELWHVEDISFHQSLLDRMLGVGTILIISHDDTNPRLELKSLPKPRPIFDMLKQRIIAVKRQRGVIKMDTSG